MFLIGEIPRTICESAYVHILDLSNNELSGALPQSQCLGNLADNLFTLNLGNNRIRGTIPTTLTKSCHLKILNKDMLVIFWNQQITIMKHIRVATAELSYKTQKRNGGD